MKRSEQFQVPVMAVMLTAYIKPADKIEIIETLLAEKKSAQWSEERKEAGDK